MDTHSSMALEPAVMEHYITIKEYFDRNVQFFTRESLEDISRQMQEAREKYTSGKRQFEFTIKGLDGVPQKVRVSLEDPIPHEAMKHLLPGRYCPPDIMVVRNALELDYRPITYAKSHVFEERGGKFEPGAELLPLVVKSGFTEVYKLTGKPISLGLMPKTTSVADYSMHLNRTYHDWKDSPCAEELKWTLHLEILRTRNLPRITKIVALACGTFYEGDRASIAQHAFILFLRTFFAKRQSQREQEIACFAQDPAYNDMDKQVLSDAGITVVDDPDGILLIDDSTFFFAVCPDVPIISVIADVARPAIMIYLRIVPEARFWHFCPRVKAMIREDYTMRNFPGDDEGFRADLAVYSRFPWR